MLNSLRKKIPASMVLYGGSVAIGALVPVVLSLVLARGLSVRDFGIWTLFVAGYGLARPIISIGISESLRTFFAAGHEGSWRSFFKQGLLLTAGSAFLWLSLFYLLTAFYQFDEPYSANFIILAVLTGMAEAMMMQSYVAVQFAGGALRYFIHNLCYVGFTAIFCGAGFLLYASWESVGVGRLLSYLVTTLTAAYVYRVIQAAPYQNLNGFAVIKRGLIHLPFELRAVAIPFLIRFAIERDLALEEVARFGVASLFGVALYLAFVAGSLFFQERLVLARQKSAQIFCLFIVRSGIMFLALLSLSAVAIWLITPFFLRIFFPAVYLDSLGLLPMVLVLNIMLCLLDFAQLIFQAAGLAHFAGYANSLFLCLIGVYVLIGPNIGSTGALLLFIIELALLFLIAAIWYLTMRHGNSTRGMGVAGDMGRQPG